MSITTYIHKLREEKDISFRQLSIDSKSVMVILWILKMGE